MSCFEHVLRCLNIWPISSSLLRNVPRYLIKSRDVMSHFGAYALGLPRGSAKIREGSLL